MSDSVTLAATEVSGMEHVEVQRHSISPLVWARFQTDPQVKSFQMSFAQPHGRPGGNAGVEGWQLKTWLGTIKEDLTLLGEPWVYGLRGSNRMWSSICIEKAQDRRAWPAIVRDTVIALEAGQFRPG